MSVADGIFFLMQLFILFMILFIVLFIAYKIIKSAMVKKE